MCGTHPFMPFLSLTMVLPAHPPQVSEPSPFHSPYLLLPILSHLCLHTHSVFSSFSPRSSQSRQDFLFFPSDSCLFHPAIAPSEPTLFWCPCSKLFVNFKAHMMKQWLLEAKIFFFFFVKVKLLKLREIMRKEVGIRGRGLPQLLCFWVLFA